MRCKITKYNRSKKDDEVIVFSENGIVPYHPKNVSYDDWKLCAEIDEHKKILDYGQSPKSLMARAAHEVQHGGLGTLITGLIVLLIIGWAMLS